eukprot:363723-Lingulodinium_polyedra.AAC.1
MAEIRALLASQPPPAKAPISIDISTSVVDFVEAWARAQSVERDRWGGRNLTTAPGGGSRAMPTLSR